MKGRMLATRAAGMLMINWLTQAIAWDLQQTHTLHTLTSSRHTHTDQQQTHTHTDQQQTHTHTLHDQVRTGLGLDLMVELWWEKNWMNLGMRMLRGLLRASESSWS